LIGVTFPPDPFVIVTEICTNGSLIDFQSNHPEKDNTDWISKLCIGIIKGIEHLHKHDIVHRDLARRNVLVVESK
jgi:serine/threonine protein kinase